MSISKSHFDVAATKSFASSGLILIFLSKNIVIYEGTGLLARAFVHEIEHLDGKLYVDFVEGGLRNVEQAEDDEYED